MIKKTPQPAAEIKLGPFLISVHRCEILGPRGGHRGWSKTTIAVNVTHTGIKVNGSEDLDLLSCRYEWDRAAEQTALSDDIAELAESLTHIVNSPKPSDIMKVVLSLIESLPDV